MSELDEALTELRDAAPSPEAIRKLATDTIRKRDNPHTALSIFNLQPHTSPELLTCNLCGVSINNTQSYVGRPPQQAQHPATIHVDWHNEIHRLTRNG